MKEYYILKWGYISGVVIEEIPFHCYQEMIRYMKFHKDKLMENGVDVENNYWTTIIKINNK